MTLGVRVRCSSGFGEVEGPEVRRLDKLAWSRCCAMLMGSACSLWNLEHACVTFWSCQGILTISQSHLTAKMADLAPTISQAATDRRESALS
jgi:hypothetical protein